MEGDGNKMRGLAKPAVCALSLSREFIYTAEKGRHSLVYVSMPPFGRRYYEFEGKKWKVID